jgi:hypothetical protein
MKRSIKNFAATLILGGIFFTPAICSADPGEEKTEDKAKIEISAKMEVKTQAEVEAIEEIRKFAKASYKKTPKHEIRQDQLIAMTVINKIENFAIPVKK